MGKNWISVITSRAHRRKKHTVSTHKRKTSKPFRIKKHKRRPRRTDAQIAAAKKRKKTNSKKSKSSGS